jgi:uncharacterized membrane protein
MINAIIKGIFFLITKLFNLILSPIISVIIALFPDLTTFFNSISTFFGYGFTYIRSILSLLCIPDTIIIALFDYFVILYSIHLTVIAVKFALTVYNKLKI